MDNHLKSSINLPVRLAISAALLSLVGCAQLMETDSSSSDNGLQPTQQGYATLLDSAAGPVVTLVIEDTKICIISRLAQNAAPEELQQSLDRHVVALQNGDVADPLKGSLVALDDLSETEAQAAARCISDSINDVLLSSNHAVARQVPRWRKINDVPFYESSFGGRHVSVLANESVDSDTKIGAFTDRGIAAGGIIATISFTVDDHGIISSGPTILTEKMARGFTTAFGNYRYTVIDAAGHVVAATNGANAEKITLCERCTDRGADQFFLALLNGEPVGNNSETLPEAPRAVYEEPSLDSYGTPPSDAFKSPEPGSLEDPLEGEVLDPDAVFDESEIDSLDLEVELDPSVDLLAE